MSDELKLAANAINVAAELLEDNKRLIKNNQILTKSLTNALEIIELAFPDPRMSSVIADIRNSLHNQQ